jgi:hypothetical protein
MRQVRLITNCERPPNYLMDLAIKYWLRTFKPDEIIFLVNNITNFDMVDVLKRDYNISATRVHSIEEASTTTGCIVWDYCVNNDYNKYHDQDALIVNELQHALLANGTDVVIFLDRDEVLYHRNLRDVLNTFNEQLIRPRGIEVIQTGEEQEYDSNKPLHTQRSHIRYYPSKSKPCITRHPYDWQVGRHCTLCNTHPHGDIAGPQSEYPGLYLIHLDKIDMNLLYNLRVESEQLFVNNRYFVGTDPQKYTHWFTEAHRNGELYQDVDFLTETGI